MRLRPIDNPPNTYLSQHAEWLEPPPPARLQIYEEEAKSIISRNDSPDVPFTWSVNPYRGCQHACAYCYARTYHEYLGYGAGTDFETKLVVKTNAPHLLRRSLRSKRWKGELLNFSGVSDCYQPLEASYEVTRRCLEACLEFRNPAVVTTRSFLIVRDAELLAKLSRQAAAAVYVSIAHADGSAAALLEPQAPPPWRRFEAIRRLREAGVPVGVLVSPVIPGLTDSDIPEILQKAAEAGAQSASFTGLRLPGSVEAVFLQRLREAMPQRADRILNRVRDIHQGCLNEPRIGQRMRGSGPYWESVRSLFAISKQRYGLGDVSAAGPHPAEVYRTATRPDPQLGFDFAC